MNPINSVQFAIFDLVQLLTVQECTFEIYDNITLFTLKLHGENNSDSIQNHLWTANDVTMKDPLKIPQGVFKATCERYLIELPQKL